MLLLVAALVVGISAGLAVGGRLRHLDTHPVGWPGLLVIGALLEAVANHWDLPGGSNWATIAGGVCLLGFAVRNLVLTGMGIVAAGLLANIAVIAIDHGMPVDPGAVVSAGIASPLTLPAVRYGPSHHRQTDTDHLLALDDRLPVPWGHLILSLGDVVLAAGIADVAAHLLQPRPRYAYQARRWRPEAPERPPDLQPAASRDETGR